MIEELLGEEVAKRTQPTKEGRSERIMPGGGISWRMQPLAIGGGWRTTSGRH
jgi:hypothetical protein